MKAVVYDRRGPAREVLRFVDRPIPEPGPGEVRIKVAVSALNPSDVKARGGQNASAAAMQFPLATPHRDGAGIIDKVGAGVDPGRAGERVWFTQILKVHAFGSAAEYTVASVALTWRLPDNASFAEGACLPIPGLTAHAVLMRDGPLLGRTVLVQGGAGAVGFYAVQIARWAGARVIATISRDEQAAVVRKAGADAIVNYKAADAQAQIEAVAGGKNAVHHIVEVNLGVNGALDAALLADNGVIATYASDSDQQPRVPFRGLNPKDATIRFVGISPMPEGERQRAASDIIRLVEQGRLIHNIATRLPLERIVEAHEMLESGRTVGKILLDVAQL